jgi:hypothetical protein
MAFVQREWLKKRQRKVMGQFVMLVYRMDYRTIQMN